MTNFPTLGTSGADIIIGTSASEEAFSGGAGDDTINGGIGNDGYLWQRGDGNDIIDETNPSGGNEDVLRLKGIKSTEVSLSRSGDDVTLIIAPGTSSASDGGSVKLLNLNPNGDAGIKSIIFDDVTLTNMDLRYKVLELK